MTGWHVAPSGPLTGELAEAAAVRERKIITLNTNAFCEEQGRKLGLDAKLTRRWERERRLLQTVKLEFPNRRRMLIGNLHATSYPPDPRLADAELRRATNFVSRQADVEEVVVVAGDFNVTREQSQTIAALVSARGVPAPARRSAGASPMRCAS